MNCNTTHYRANSSSVPGDPTVKKLVRARGGWTLKGRQGPLRKLRVRAKKNQARVSFTAVGLDLFAVTPPFTIRVDVGNDSGVVTVPCTVTDNRVTCQP